MSEQNTALVDRAIAEVWNQGDFSRLDELVSNDIVVHGSAPGSDIHGPEGVRQFYTMLRDAFPDLHFTIEDQIASGDRVVTRWTASGTHRGDFQGIAPTGRQVRVSGVDIDRIVDGKVVECWPIADYLYLLQQLGVVPAPEQTK
jgi:steroid delta-isomerase-like uncharacterized protein